MITLSAAQRSAISHLIAGLGTPAAMAKRARVVLYTASGMTEEQVSKRLKLELTEVEETLEAWEEAEKKLRVAEQAGIMHLRAQVKAILAPLSDHGSDCGCGCQDEENARKSLNELQIAKVAVKVYDLLRYELRIERERIAISRHGM